MSFVAVALRASKTRLLQRTLRTAPRRAFHSPFAVLGTSPITQPSSKDIVNQYEKHYDHPMEPLESSSNQGYPRTYVVSEPDASYKHYQVPAGAYPTSAPYTNFNPTMPPVLTTREEHSSTGGGLLAHEFTTRRVPTNRSGVGESSAVRFAEAPGEMGARGGAHGGKGMMDREGTVQGREEGSEASLADRNPAPDDPQVAEKFSKAGLEGAWKLRK